jgi:hypothetical protein
MRIVSGMGTPALPEPKPPVATHARVRTVLWKWLLWRLPASAPWYALVAACTNSIANDTLVWNSLWLLAVPIVATVILWFSEHYWFLAVLYPLYTLFFPVLVLVLSGNFIRRHANAFQRRALILTAIPTFLIAFGAMLITWFALIITQSHYVTALVIVNLLCLLVVLLTFLRWACNPLWWIEAATFVATEIIKSSAFQTLPFDPDRERHLKAIKN